MPQVYLDLPTNYLTRFMRDAAAPVVAFEVDGPAALLAGYPVGTVLTVQPTREADPLGVQWAVGDQVVAEVAGRAIIAYVREIEGVPSLVVDAETPPVAIDESVAVVGVIVAYMGGKPRA